MSDVSIQSKYSLYNFNNEVECLTLTKLVTAMFIYFYEVLFLIEAGGSPVHFRVHFMRHLAKTRNISK